MTRASDGRWVPFVATALAGALAMGGDPPPATVPPGDAAGTEAAIAKLLPTPRLYDIVVTVGGVPTVTAQGCVGAGPAAQLLDALRQIGRDAGPDAETGCARTIARQADGSAHSETTCDMAHG